MTAIALVHVCHVLLHNLSCCTEFTV